MQIPVGNLVAGTATIASSGTTSGNISTDGLNLVGVQMPAAFTGTSISFKGSLDGTTFQPVYSTVSDTLLSYSVLAAHYVAFDPTPLQGLPFIQIVSNATEAAARSIGYALKG